MFREPRSVGECLGLGRCTAASAAPRVQRGVTFGSMAGEPEPVMVRSQGTAEVQQSGQVRTLVTTIAVVVAALPRSAP